MTLPSDVKFISVRRWKTGPEWKPLAHSHSFCEIIVVVQGVERAVVADTTLQCEPGQVLFYPPHCIHEERQAGDTALEFLCVDFEWPDCPDAFPHIIQDGQGRLQETARWLIVEDRVAYPGKGNYQECVARMLVAELMRLSECPPQDMLETVHEYVYEHLDKSLSLDDLAAIAQVDKFHLTRVFRARTGLTPMQFVRDARLELAHRLLMETDLRLCDIAPRTGFANEYHLSRLIKGRYGRGARDLRRSR